MFDIIVRTRSSSSSKHALLKTNWGWNSGFNKRVKFVASTLFGIFNIKLLIIRRRGKKHDFTQIK